MWEFMGFTAAAIMIAAGLWLGFRSPKRTLPMLLIGAAGVNVASVIDVTNAADFALPVNVAADSPGVVDFQLPDVRGEHAVIDFRLSDAGTVNTAPVHDVNVVVWAPDWCGVCRKMEAEVGPGSKTARVQFRHGSDRAFPGFVQAYARRYGEYPIVQYRLPNGRWKIVARRKSLSQLETLVSGR